ncbi:hypothetical protein [Rathayibacter toxicus]|nr:hypothetical protein [Rathayibacter toxicus]
MSAITGTLALRGAVTKTPATTGSGGQRPTPLLRRYRAGAATRRDNRGGP